MVGGPANGKAFGGGVDRERRVRAFQQHDLGASGHVLQGLFHAHEGLCAAVGSDGGRNRATSGSTVAASALVRIVSMRSLNTPIIL